MESRQEVFRNLYHYTPLFKIIKGILNTKTDIGKEEPKMNFLFGAPLSVNDKNEGCLYLKYLFSRCERNNEFITSCWQKLNHIFILCFIRHKSYKKYHVNSIPMWKMYGGDFKGFRMTLDYEKLNAFCQPNGCQLVKIQYVTKDELRKIAQEKYNEIKYRLSSCLNDEILIKEITSLVPIKAAKYFINGVGLSPASFTKSINSLRTSKKALSTLPLSLSFLLCSHFSLNFVVVIIT